MRIETNSKPDAKGASMQCIIIQWFINIWNSNTCCTGAHTPQISKPFLYSYRNPRRIHKISNFRLFSYCQNMKSNSFCIWCVCIIAGFASLSQPPTLTIHHIVYLCILHFMIMMIKFTTQWIFIKVNTSLSLYNRLTFIIIIIRIYTSASPPLPCQTVYINVLVMWRWWCECQATTFSWCPPTYISIFTLFSPFFLYQLLQGNNLILNLNSHAMD